jgi:hypothetical protein
MLESFYYGNHRLVGGECPLNVSLSILIMQHMISFFQQRNSNYALDLEPPAVKGKKGRPASYRSTAVQRLSVDALIKFLEEQMGGQGASKSTTLGEWLLNMTF